jgi:hypothetical protein
MTAETNISLKVPFSEKDQAKALGARWNAEQKLWYVPQGVESAPFAKWFSDAASPVAAKAATNSPARNAAASTSAAAADDDMDAINARFRDAYETRDFDASFDPSST